MSPSKLVSPRRIHSAASNVDDVLNHDFCPWANKYVYWMKNPIWLLLASIIVSAICGFYLNTAVFGLTATLVVIALLGTFWPYVSIRGIDCRVEFDKSRTKVGQSIPVKLIVTNRWPWPIWGLNLQQGFFVENTSEDGVALRVISGWSQSEFIWDYAPTTRGVYPIDVPRVDTSFPFDLSRSSKAVVCDQQLIVWPKTTQLRTIPDASESNHSEDRFTDKRAGDFGEMIGTRTFRPGDSLRRVHWSQTARQGQLIVCEHQAPAMTAVRLIVDVSRKHHVINSNMNSLESMIETVASVCQSLHLQHAYVECQIGTQTYRCGESEASFRKLMDTLAKIPHSGVETTEATMRPASSSREAFTLLFTTDQAIDSGELATGSARMVVFNTQPTNGQALSSESTVRAWMTLNAADYSLDQLDDHWRRACHAA